LTLGRSQPFIVTPTTRHTRILYIALFYYRRAGLFLNQVRVG